MTAVLAVPLLMAGVIVALRPTRWYIVVLVELGITAAIAALRLGHLFRRTSTSSTFLAIPPTDVTTASFENKVIDESR